MPSTASIDFALQPRFFKRPSLNQPSFPFAVQTAVSLDPPTNLAAVQTRQERQTNKAMRSEQHPYRPSIKSTKGSETFPFTGHNCKNQVFQIYTGSKSLEKKTSLRTRSSWFGVFLRSIKNRS